MKIAFIVDLLSLEKEPKDQDTFFVPYLLHYESGTIKKTYNHSELKQYIKNNSTIHEPTPGMYRDSYKELQSLGYDYIIVIPPSKKINKAYTFAKYATTTNIDNVVVIDVDDYDLEPVKLYEELQNEKQYYDIKKIHLDFDALIDFARGILINISKLTKAD